ncbi:hypothetical protein [Streptomyces sp. NPDC054975]
MEAIELDAFRAHRDGHTFWCGVWLGGCGQQLTNKLYKDRACHFAHLPDPEHTSTCGRRAAGMHQNVYLRRCLYTGESVQQARRAVDSLEPDTPPIPSADSPAQQHFEARVLLGLLEFRNLYTRYPLGITAVRPEPDGIALHVESEERAAEILFNLLPTYVSEEDHEVHGVPGLRITQRDRTASELRVLGEPTRLRLTGLPARLWRSAIARMLDK